MARTSAMYTFNDEIPSTARKVSQDDPSTDGNGSLSYSAASSVNSGMESADSSLLLKGLEAMHDSKEIANFLEQRNQRRDEKSVADSLAYSTNADSLAYSTDADTHFKSAATIESSKLHGSDLLESMYGYGETKVEAAPQSRQDDVPIPAPDGDLDILFAPAQHSDSLKRRKMEKKRARDANRTPTTKKKPVPVTAESQRRRPARLKYRSHVEQATEGDDDDDDEMWYSKWWMLCFPEMMRQTSSPKR